MMINNKSNINGIESDTEDEENNKNFRGRQWSRIFESVNKAAVNNPSAMANALRAWLYQK